MGHVDFSKRVAMAEEDEEELRRQRAERKKAKKEAKKEQAAKPPEEELGGMDPEMAAMMGFGVSEEARKTKRLLSSPRTIKTQPTRTSRLEHPTFASALATVSQPR